MLPAWWTLPQVQTSWRVDAVCALREVALRYCGHTYVVGAGRTVNSKTHWDIRYYGKCDLKSTTDSKILKTSVFITLTYFVVFSRDLYTNDGKVNLQSWQNFFEAADFSSGYSEEKYTNILVCKAKNAMQ